MVNCTIASNTCGKSTGGASGVGGWFRNCLIADNLPNDIGEYSELSSCVWVSGGSAAASINHNCQVDSSQIRFAAADRQHPWGFGLKRRSAATGWGDNALADFTDRDVDLAGSPRLRGTDLDVGCYSYLATRGLMIFVR